MPNTYTQIHIHAVFAVKFRAAKISPAWKDRLHQYITGIVQNQTHKMIAINSMPDHMHLFFGMRPAQSLSDLMRMIKGDSSEWINKEKFLVAPFRWQDGFGAFSHARSQIKTVADYVENRQMHHHKKTFRDEYKDLLRLNEIEYDDRYIFKELE